MVMATSDPARQPPKIIARARVADAPAAMLSPAVEIIGPRNTKLVPCMLNRPDPTGPIRCVWMSVARPDTNNDMLTRNTVLARSSFSALQMINGGVMMPTNTANTCCKATNSVSRNGGLSSRPYSSSVALSRRLPPPSSRSGLPGCEPCIAVLYRSAAASSFSPNFSLTRQYLGDTIIPNVGNSSDVLAKGGRHAVFAGFARQHHGKNPGPAKRRNSGGSRRRQRPADRRYQQDRLQPDGLLRSQLPRSGDLLRLGRGAGIQGHAPPGNRPRNRRPSVHRSPPGSRPGKPVG